MTTIEFDLFVEFQNKSLDNNAASTQSAYCDSNMTHQAQVQLYCTQTHSLEDL